LHNNTHFVWNYWYVENHYLYLRAFAAGVIGHELYNDFTSYLAKYAREQLGMNTVTGAYLSLYVNGCHQTTHSDQMNGTYGYVWSLTKWDKRTFTGGETLIAKPGVFDQLEPRSHMGQGTYWDIYPSTFNQLLLFDDRVPHLVTPVSGQMDPKQGRCVLHGHIY
jgi:Rps23 Pro-64 3,4-dihydroxylase Tpa1-like proline 4-hydroxylase